jgi:hypothetical protein
MTSVKVQNAKVQTARERMANIRASLKCEVDAIRENTNYSPDGRKCEIAKTYLAHRKKAVGLREEFKAASKARSLVLGRQLFGLPAGGDATAYRDAVDRAEAIRSSEAAESMFARAQRTGDTLLARAVASHAFDRGWNAVSRSYAEEAGQSLALDELSDLRGCTVSSLGEAALFGIPSPEELHGYRSNADLEKLVERAA